METKITTFDQYRKAAMRTCPSLGRKEVDMLHMKYGVITELGEIVDIFKKNLAYNKPIDVIHLKEELGDLFWYLACGSEIEGVGCSEEQIAFWTKTGKVLPTEDNIMLILNIIYFSWAEALYYSFLLANILSRDFGFKLYEDVLTVNIQKLQARYPDKFDTEKALNRDLDKERKILES